MSARREAELELLQRYGGNWGEHPDYPAVDWRHEVWDCNTRRGYWDWVMDKLGVEP